MSLTLVTGGAGWLAGLVADAWPAGSVRRVDRRPADDVLVAELGEDTDWSPLLDGIDTVLHLAGEGRADAPVETLWRTNVDLTRSLLSACARHGVRRVVLASSVWATAGLWRRERPVPGDAPADAGDLPYGESKAAAEAELRAWAHLDDAHTGIALRLGGCVRGGDSPRAPQDAWEDGCWLGRADWVRAASAAVAVDRAGFHVATVTSTCTVPGWDLRPARDLLGYQPVEALELTQDRRPRARRRGWRWAAGSSGATS